MSFKVLHEEILDVVASDEFQSSLQQSGGACAQVIILYGLIEPYYRENIAQNYMLQWDLI